MLHQQPWVFAIDVEPSAGPRQVVEGSADEWSGPERCIEHFAKSRDQVLEQTSRPLRSTWFFRVHEQGAAWARTPDGRTTLKPAAR